MTLSGELSALTSALLWASASVIYARYVQQLHPVLLNTLKGVISAVLIAFTAYIFSLALTGVFDNHALLLLLVSGALGIGLGDSLYFAALKHIGARLALLIQMLTPPLTVLLAIFYPGEIPGPYDYAGISLCLLGITWVVYEKSPGPVQPAGTSKTIGISLAVVAALCAACGTVLARDVMQHTHDAALQSTFLRLMGGNFILIPWLLSRPLAYRKIRISAKTGIILLAAIFFGTYLSIWLQQIALTEVQAGVAQTLFSTSPLFVIPITMLMGEKVSWRAFSGVLIALGGVAILFLR